MSESRYPWRVSRSMNTAWPKPTEQQGFKKMLCWKQALYHRWLKSLFPAWGITAFKGYYNYFMCKQKENKNQTARILKPPFSSLSGLWESTNRGKSERKAWRAGALQAAVNLWLSAAPGLLQPRTEGIFRTPQAFIFSAGVSVHLRGSQEAETSGMCPPMAA